jgi:hypothetical protein
MIVDLNNESAMFFDTRMIHSRNVLLVMEMNVSGIGERQDEPPAFPFPEATGMTFGVSIWNGQLEVLRVHLTGRSRGGRRTTVHIDVSLAHARHRPVARAPLQSTAQVHERREENLRED